MSDKIKNPETIGLHGGEYRSDPATTAVAVPIYQTTSYQNLVISILELIILLVTFLKKELLL